MKIIFKETKPEKIIKVIKGSIAAHSSYIPVDADIEPEIVIDGQLYDIHEIQRSIDEDLTVTVRVSKSRGTAL